MVLFPTKGSVINVRLLRFIAGLLRHAKEFHYYLSKFYSRLPRRLLSNVFHQFYPIFAKDPYFNLYIDRIIGNKFRIFPRSDIRNLLLIIHCSIISFLSLFLPLLSATIVDFFLILFLSSLLLSGSLLLLRRLIILLGRFKDVL